MSKSVSMCVNVNISVSVKDSVSVSVSVNVKVNEICIYMCSICACIGNVPCSSLSCWPNPSVSWPPLLSRTFHCQLKITVGMGKTITGGDITGGESAKYQSI